jgi:hypothetical protein
MENSMSAYKKIATLGIITSAIFASVQSHAVSPQPPTYSITFYGQCKYRIIPNTSLLLCRDDVLYRLESGVAIFNFRTNSQMFMLGGSGDRQPNPSNLYQSINDAWIVANNEVQFRENDFEGVCHLSLASDANKFYFVNCIAYNRQRQQYFELQLSKIRKFTKS